MPQILEEKRFHAALASEGISAGPIYQTVLHLFAEHCGCTVTCSNSGPEPQPWQKSSVVRMPGTITCVDIRPRPECLPAAILWLQTDLNYPIPIQDNSYNFVISTEVIEHLENPRATFREFYRLLRPGGILIVTTPNQESVRSFAGLLMGGHFAGFLGPSYPAHITALLRKDFQRICRETRFDSPQFYYTNSGGIPKLPHILWQTLTFGILKGRLFSDNLAVVTRKS